MNRAAAVVLVIGLVPGFAVRAQAKSIPSPRGPRLAAVTLVIRHRVFHDFLDEQRVKLNQEFLLGDTDYSGRVVRYVPDFEMDLGTRRVFSRTSQPNNPAFEIVIRKSRVPQDTSWAFLNMPPHFSRRALFAFQVVRIDFADRASLFPDTTSATPSAPPGHAASPARTDSASRDTANHR